MTLRLLSLLCLAAVALAACASPKIVRGEYVLVEVDGQSISPDPAIEVKIEAGWLYGAGPVNRWQASLEGGRVGTVACTRKAGPPALMDLEQSILAALDGASLHAGEGGAVEVRQGGEVVARLAPAPAAR